jgi:hypothetical protein
MFGVEIHNTLQSPVLSEQSVRLSFSGHESFVCRHYWLRKGFDFVAQNRSFSSPDTVVSLGVGKNMVSAIRFWLRAFAITNEKDEPTELGSFLLAPKAKDPYLEDIGTLWLLHHSIVTARNASIYNLFFNGFALEKSEFSKEQFLSYLIRHAAEQGLSLSDKTAQTDVNVFFRMYCRSRILDVDDDAATLLTELNLIRSDLDLERKVSGAWYYFSSDTRSTLPPEVVLYSILRNTRYGSSISLRDLLTTPDSPGRVFGLNRDGLFMKLEALQKQNRNITISGTAGNHVLQFRTKPTWQNVLESYYANAVH